MPDFAVFYDNICGLKFLLSKGANVNVRNKAGRTPLEIAISKENVEAGKLLLDYGANIHSQVRNLNSETMKEVAKTKGFTAIYDKLLEYEKKKCSIETPIETVTSQKKKKKKRGKKKTGKVMQAQVSTNLNKNEE